MILPAHLVATLAPTSAPDPTRMHHRTVTSFYSSLVTRPTGRAVRLGVESQLAELGRESPLLLSVLDFSQVRLLDYSCADEIVAKLLLRYRAEDRPGEAFFLVRGLQDHHLDAIEAVLERHRLLLAAELEPGDACLLGPADVVQRACWAALSRQPRASAAQVAQASGLSLDAAAATLAALAAHRVVLRLAPQLYRSVVHLAAEE